MMIVIENQIIIFLIKEENKSVDYQKMLKRWKFLCIIIIIISYSKINKQANNFS